MEIQQKTPFQMWTYVVNEARMEWADIECESRTDVIKHLEENKRSDYYDLICYQWNTGDVIFKERVDISGNEDTGVYDDTTGQWSSQ